MFKGTPETVAQRREEIVAACEQLYRTMSFKDITLKEVSNVTSFSRPTIYNYFQTKEEIFLALFEREYERWNADLEEILNSDEKYSEQQLAELTGFQRDLHQIKTGGADHHLGLHRPADIIYSCSESRLLKNS